MAWTKPMISEISVGLGDQFLLAFQEVILSFRL